MSTLTKLRNKAVRPINQLRRFTSLPFFVRFERDNGSRQRAGVIDADFKTSPTTDFG